MCSIACWVPPSPLMSEQASLFRSGVPLYSPLEGHSLWDLALITPGFAKSYLFYFILTGLMASERPLIPLTGCSSAAASSLGWCRRAMSGDRLGWSTISGNMPMLKSPCIRLICRGFQHIFKTVMKPCDFSCGTHASYVAYARRRLRRAFCSSLIGWTKL